MNQTHCEHRQDCPIFDYFEKTSKTILMRYYCEGDFLECERYKLRKVGRIVPDDLLPTGRRKEREYDDSRSRNRAHSTVRTTF